MTTGSSVPDSFALVSHSTAAAGTYDFEIVSVIFSGLFSLVVALLIFIVVMTVVRERRRREQLYAHAMRCGWHPATTAAPVPGPVATATDSRRTRLVLRTRLQGYDMWLVWHQWTESTGVGDSPSQTTRNLTRYFLWLGDSYPNLRVERRTRIGALFKPVRGTGTADAEFDKQFLIRGVESHEALRVLTPSVRHAMVAGHLSVWEISGGVLIITYHDLPRVENLQPRADAIVYLARMLT